MYKDKIVDFVSRQSVEEVIPKGSELKTIRRAGDCSKWFGPDDEIEFDDSAETFCMKVNLTDNILKIAKTLNITVIRDGKRVNLEREPFKCVKEVVGAVASFFLFAN